MWVVGAVPTALNPTEEYTAMDKQALLEDLMAKARRVAQEDGTTLYGAADWVCRNDPRLGDMSEDDLVELWDSIEHAVAAEEYK